MVFTVFVYTNYILDADPEGASIDIWRRSGCEVAANGAVMRDCVLGCVRSDDMEFVVRNAMLACHVTHVDPRCSASCVAHCTAIASFINGDDVCHDGDWARHVEDVLEHSIERGKQILERETARFRETYTGDNKLDIRALFSNDYATDYDFFTSKNRTLIELVCRHDGRCHGDL